MEDQGRLTAAKLRWLLDVTEPILIEDTTWREKREQVLALPRWFYDPPDEVKAAFASLRGEGPRPEPFPWDAVKAHVERDFIAFLWHFCWLKERDPPRRLMLATPQASQLVIAWRVMTLIHKEMPVRIDLLKERQGGFSWLFTQIVGWLICFRPRHAAIQVAHDKDTTKKVFRYLKDLHEQLPAELRPTDEYSSRTELTLREKREERLKGNPGLDSSCDVQTAGNDFVGTGQPVQIAHVTEVGKWHVVCDPETVYGSAVNAIQPLAGTYIFRESTAFGAGTYWHNEWKASLKMGKPGWNGHTPIFLPWYFDSRNAFKCAPDMELSQREDNEFGNEVEEIRRYGLSNEQIEWRRRRMEAQPEGRRKVDIFRQEHPGSQAEAWLNAFGKWLEPDLVTRIRVRIDVEKKSGLLTPIFEGDIDPKRELGENLPFLLEGEDRNDWLRRRRGGPLKIFRLPDYHLDSIIGGDFAENLGLDNTCLKGYFRVGSGRDEGAKMRLTFEYYGGIDEDDVADVMWRLGYFYSVGVASDRLPAMLAWERTGSGRSIAKWLRKGKRGGTDPYPHQRMYRRHNPEDPKFKIDGSYGISTSPVTKPVMLSAWKQAAKDGEIQITEEDLEEATTLVVDERGLIDTQGRDRFMASCMAMYGALFTPVLWGKDAAEKKEPARDTVAWAMKLEEQRRADSKDDMLERRVFSLED